MAKVDGIEEEEHYTTSVEVDGIRRTLDSFMKSQEASNEAMKKSLDDVLATLTRLGGQPVEDKGSTIKGKRPELTRHFYSNPHSTEAYLDAPGEINWSNHDNLFVEYDLIDCPWNAEELEQLYKFAAIPTHDLPKPMRPNQSGHQMNRQDTHQVQHTIPNTVFMQPAPHFQTHMQFQHRAVAKGPKLSFPEFDGSDPDGWIRKAEKYYELVGVPNEDKVKIVVLYISGKAEYWWRGTGCNANSIPSH